MASDVSLRNGVAFVSLLMVSLLVIIPSISALPSISLPPATDPGSIQAQFHHWGPTSYWEVDLWNVSSGYDVVDGKYADWCVDQSHQISNNAILAVNLYSSYDTNMPSYFSASDGNWSKVNYIINHKGNATKEQVQHAIWYFIGGGYGGADSVVDGLISAADAHPNYEPQPGQLLGVLLDAGENVQHTFMEVQVLPLTPLAVGSLPGFVGPALAILLRKRSSS